jgi:hypothetical protein
MEKKYRVEVSLGLQGITDYTFETESEKDAVSYVIDNVKEDFDLDITEDSILKIEVIN